MVELSDLVAVEGLGLNPIHLAESARPLRWVATSELPDPTPFLEGGELLLTTGLETKGWRTQWSGYVQRLVDAGVVAVGLGVGLTHAVPPAALVRACQRHDLSLVEVPRETAFVAVSQAAARLLEDEEAAAARISLDFQRRLTQAALGMDTAALLERLGQLLAGAAAVVSRDGQVEAGPSGPDPGLLDVVAVTKEARRIRGQGFGAISTVAEPGCTTVVRPIGLEGRPASYLAVAIAGAMGTPQRSAITTAGVLLSLAVERRAERRSADRRLRARALDFVLRDDRRTAAVLLEAAEPPIRLPSRLCILRAAGDPDAVADAMSRVEDAGLLVGVVDDELVCVAPAQRAGDLAGDVLADSLQVGVGRAVGAVEARRSYETAGFALGETTPAAPLRQWDDLADAGPVGLIPASAARAYADSFLAPLDGEHRTLLASFLRHHGSRGAVADELGVHRNTVRNRVAEIERRLAASLDDPGIRAGAWIALRVADADR